MESLVQIVLYACLAVILYAVAKNFIGKLLNHPPSPFLNLPVIGHLYLVKKPLYRSLARISDRYGPVVLLQLGCRRVLVVSSPTAVEECFTKNDVVFANRPHLLAGKHLGDNYTSLAWASYGDHWRNLRKIASVEVLSTLRLQSLHSIRADEVKSTVKRLSRAAGEGKAVEMKTVFFELTMNVMMRMIAGKKYYGEKVEELEEAGRFRDIISGTFRLGVSNMADFLPFLSWLLGDEKELVRLRLKRDQFMQELVDSSRKRLLLLQEKKSTEEDDHEEKKTMIEELLVLQQKQPEYYTDAMIKSLMLVLLAAGTDTSAGTMEWAITLLLYHPHVLKKAQAEIDLKIGHERLLDESDVAVLPYLRSIINETLRIFPAGPVLDRHESSEQCTVGGYRVPAGTLLLVNLWAMQKDPKYWPEGARDFNPERFDGLDGTRDGFRHMPFGSGRRSCPGEGLAIRMLVFGLGSIIQCFDWTRVGDGPIDMTEGTGLTLPKAKPLLAYCRVRPAAAKLLSQII